MLRLIMVPIIMGCALFGTIGMIKGIEKFFPNTTEKFKSRTDNENKNEEEKDR